MPIIVDLVDLRRNALIIYQKKMVEEERFVQLAIYPEGGTNGSRRIIGGKEEAPNARDHCKCATN